MKKNIKIRKSITTGLLFLLLLMGAGAQEVGDRQAIIYTPTQQKLRIMADDVKLIPEEDKSLGGFHLYVRKLPNVQSILLTETTKDPHGISDNYTYRAKEYNKVNGDEIRLLDGKPLVSEGAKYSLVDSSIEYTEFFGPAFHIYIPPTIVYGYDWSRNGEVTIAKGTFINIRAFDKPFADYTGNYVDNPFMFDLVTKRRKATKPELSKTESDKKESVTPGTISSENKLPLDKKETVITDEYNPVASDKFKDLSTQLIYSKGPDTIIEDIMKIFEEGNFKDNTDIVFAIDATGSMKNDIDKLKQELLPAVKNYLGENSNTRVGLLFYRDYGDTFKYRGLPVLMYNFTKNYEAFGKNLNAVKILGREGGDIPEAVYEAIYASAMYFDWRDDANKQVILIGDAEPHPTPRGTGKYSREYVRAVTELKGIEIHSILLPKE